MLTGSRIVVNAQYVPDVPLLDVMFRDGSTARASVVGRNQELALLKLKAPVHSHALPLAFPLLKSGNMFVTIKNGNRRFGRMTGEFTDPWGRTLVRTSLKHSSSMVGTPALNRRGEVIGFFVSGNLKREYEHIMTVDSLSQFLASTPSRSETLLRLSYEGLRKSSVFIKSGTGSGSIQSKGFIGPGGRIVTTAVAERGPVTVYLPCDPTPYTGVVTGNNGRLAIIELDDNLNLPTLSLAKKDLSPGDDFVSVYYLFCVSFMENGKIAFGTITKDDRDWNGNPVLATSILAPGHNNGIAAMNKSGEVAGIFTYLSPSRPYECMIPASAIARMVNSTE